MIGDSKNIIQLKGGYDERKEFRLVTVLSGKVVFENLNFTHGFLGWSASFAFAVSNKKTIYGGLFGAGILIGDRASVTMTRCEISNNFIVYPLGFPSYGMIYIRYYYLFIYNLYVINSDLNSLDRCWNSQLWSFNNDRL